MNEIISEKKLDHFTPTCKVEYKQAYISEWNKNTQLVSTQHYPFSNTHIFASVHLTSTYII
jgi:hypothetical protein